MIHRLTYPNLSPHTQSHTHTNTNHQTINKATHTQTIKPVGANNGHHTHHPSHRSANPSHQSETHVVNLKPKPPIKKNITGANLFKKKIITGANPLKKKSSWSHQSKPIKKKSSPKPPSKLLMINPTDPPIDQQIHCFKPTDQPIQTHHQPIPAHRSKPSSSIHADPTSKIQNPGDGDEASEMRE